MSIPWITGNHINVEEIMHWYENDINDILSEKHIAEKYVIWFKQCFSKYVNGYSCYKKLCELHNRIVWKMVHILSHLSFEIHKAHEYITGFKKSVHKIILFHPNYLIEYLMILHNSLKYLQSILCVSFTLGSVAVHA